MSICNKTSFIKSLIFIPVLFFTTGLAAGESFSHSENLKLVDEYTLVGDKNLISDVPAHGADGSLNIVVEIPTGSNQKWEVDKRTGQLKWEFKKGKPRVVSYLGYPGNYGMIPGTLLPKELGGDGDPLDVLVLGPAVPRGSIVNARLIGVLKLLDGGEQDDKLIAVLDGTAFDDVSSVEELRNKFVGVLDIVEIWFANYKGPNEIEVKGYDSVESAEKVLEAAINAYNERN